MARIFISPSEQFANVYAGMQTNEGEQMGKLGILLAEQLREKGHEIMMMHEYSMYQKVMAADAFGADLYICLHSNAYNNQVSGCRIFTWDSESEGYKAGNLILEHLGPLTPGYPDKICPNPGLYEVRMPTAPVIYIEVDFHDVAHIARWITEHLAEIAVAIAAGVYDYLGEAPVSIYTEPGVMYTVQAGAFRDRLLAEKFLETVRIDYPDAFIKEETYNEG